MSRPLRVPAGLSIAPTVTLRDATGTAVTDYYDGSEALAVSVWPGDDRAALAWGCTAVWLSAAGGTVTVTIPCPAGTAPGVYTIRLTVAGKLAWQQDLEVIASPGSATAPAVYHSYDEQLRVSPWIAGLEDPGVRTGYEEERSEARQALEELAQARYRGDWTGGGYASGYAGQARSETLAAWLAEDRLIVTPDVRLWLGHWVAALVARRQVGPGASKDYLALAEYHERQVTERSATLLLGIDTTEPADGTADLWIDCGEARIARG